MSRNLTEVTSVEVIRVIYADDDPALLEGISGLIAADSRIRIVGTAEGGRSVLHLLELHRADVVLLDVEMPDLDGVETARIISGRYPEVKIIMFTAFEVESRLMEAFSAGAVAFLTKDMEPREIVDAIADAVEGRPALAPRAVASAIGILHDLGEKRRAGDRWRETKESLSEGPRRVYRYLIEGATNKEIAARTGYSETTVRTYVSFLLESFGCATRTELAVRALRASTALGDE